MYLFGARINNTFPAKELLLRCYNGLILQSAVSSGP